MSINFFVLFLATSIVVLLFLFLNQANRWKALLAGSLLFYTLLTGYQVLFPCVFAFIVYAGGKYIQRQQAQQGKGKGIASLFIAAAVLPLLVVKLLPIFPFLQYAMPSLAPEHRAFQSSLLEIAGISFFTFNGISYLVDVRKKYVKAEQNYFLVLLYIIFFPIILSGPLQRSGNLMDQFKNHLMLSNENFSRGFRLVLWGVFKNFVIAQECYYFMDAIQRNHPQGLYVLLQGFSFFIYLYFNFSSYVDIFSGIARIFNIEVSKNFGNRVYAATSRKQFWEQWHITLNHWFRDYVFFPMAKGVKSRLHFNMTLLATFVLIGLWHGITVRYLIWGFVNGCWILLEQRFTPFCASLPRSLRFYGGRCYHLLIASTVALLFSTIHPLTTYQALFSATSIHASAYQYLLKDALYILAIFIPFDYLSKKMDNVSIDIYLNTHRASVRWIFYLLLACCILASTDSWSIQNYYFRF